MVLSKKKSQANRSFHSSLTEITQVREYLKLPPIRKMENGIFLIFPCCSIWCSSISDWCFMSSRLSSLKVCLQNLSVGGTDQTNSLHTEQKVGCLKNVAMNSWFFMKWIFACLMAPRLRFRVGASSSFAACLLSSRQIEKTQISYPTILQMEKKQKVTLYTSKPNSFNDHLWGPIGIAHVNVCG